MNFKKRITVLLADDHMIVRQGLLNLLKLEDDIEVIGEAVDGCQTVELSRKLHPDVISMDVAMPLMNGFEATRKILETNPGTKVIILSAHNDSAYVEYATSLGAKGYLVKQTSAQYLAEAIRVVYQGNTFFSPSLSNRFQNHP